jgi:hypothetical protein
MQQRYIPSEYDEDGNVTDGGYYEEYDDGVTTTAPDVTDNSGDEIVAPPNNADGTPYVGQTDEQFKSALKAWAAANNVLKPDGTIDWAKYDQSSNGYAGSLLTKLLKTNGTYDPAKIAGLGLGAYGLMGGNIVTNDNLYKGTIPNYVATRQQVAVDPNRVPGSKGQQYFTDTLYNKSADTAGIANAHAQTIAQEADLKRSNLPVQLRSAAGIPSVLPQALQFTTPPELNMPTQPTPAQPMQQTQGLAHGGIAGQYLRGNTDGMADKLNTTIDNTQPAKLSHGEFVIPADVVSHLGNGNSDAGAQKLYAMMDRVRKARTGSAKQGKAINADKFLGGGIAGYAGGGAIAFAGTDGSLVPSAITAASPLGNTTTTGLSQFAGDYVGNMLGKGAAIANTPYQAYTGQLTAGPSDLQSKVQTGLEGISMPTNYGKSFTDTGIAQQYMNPYIQSALDPQIAEARRQSQITQMGNDSKAVAAGAYGGDRNAVMNAETQRNLGTNLANITGQGYNTAFNNAQNQFNTEQGQGTGLVNQMAQQGATQQATTQAGLTADQAQFNEQRDNPYKMVQYQQGLLQGLPISSTSTTPNQTGASNFLTSVGGAKSIYDQIKQFFPT